MHFDNQTFQKYSAIISIRIHKLDLIPFTSSNNLMTERRHYIGSKSSWSRSAKHITQRKSSMKIECDFKISKIYYIVTAITNSLIWKNKFHVYLFKGARKGTSYVLSFHLNTLRKISTITWFCHYIIYTWKIVLWS